MTPNNHQKTYNIRWSDRIFEKTEEATTMQDAVKIAKDPLYWPIEISNYQHMTTVISDGDSEIIFPYSELKNL